MWEYMAMNKFNKMVKEFHEHFAGETKDLINYLVDNKIMSKKEIAEAMGISRPTLYKKYLGEK